MSNEILQQLIGKTIKSIYQHQTGNYKLTIIFDDNSILDVDAVGDDMTYVEIDYYGDNLSVSA